MLPEGSLYVQRMRVQCFAILLAHFSMIRALSGWYTQPSVETALPQHRDHGVQSSSARGQFARDKVNICETTKGVNSYSGYIDLDEHSHLFFWFFEARQSPKTAPITLWLNGGPGSDSLLGLFTDLTAQEIGPCTVNPDLTTSLNPFSWSETSNLLFLSQPLGVGFSYGTKGEGTFDGSNTTTVDTSQLAARTAWHAVQAFLAELPQMSPKIRARDFNLWTESYGGHYGPVFLRHFSTENELIKTGSKKGYPNFTANNTYGIQPLDDQVVAYMKFASSMYNGCRDQVYGCRQAYSSDEASIETRALCSRAANMCRDNVEGPYYEYSDRSMYDIRKSSQDPAYTDFFIKYLNLPSTQEALGVKLLSKYEPSSNEVYSAFQLSGDYVYPGYIDDLAFLLDKGVRVVLSYGDADYIGNWFGGEAVSLALNYSYAPFFRSTSYVRLTVDGTDHGIIREYGNFSFVVVYDAGHMVPTDKPDVALEIFRRSISGLDIATGLEPISNQPTVPLTPDEPFASTTPESAART
ncbi:alpha/beta-hydrolase [Coniochaeta ligniaria NRRL 30616]|uniref:Carboxypeptidase n=1 Tax=Coniochaeta ligniaria NRRL 30616 TaxID=1408157 RepID=A0A1J7J785_9PEZI|nr:alpha/beta-hydrolase [Coniochaeta ligniaria NRRL 30616]